MRFLLRFLSFLALVVAVLVAVVDSVQSVSAAQLVLTPLGTVLAAMGEQTLPIMQGLEMPEAGFLHPLFRWVFRQPAFAVFLLIAFLFWILAYRRPLSAGRFTA